MSDDEEHDEYMGAELYAAERHAEAAESLLRDAVIRADAAEKRVAVLEEALKAALPAVEREALRLLLTVKPDEMAEGKSDGATAIVDLVKAALATTEGE